ncbi:MAG: hypothetical protein GC172_02020 [Phycisphaera sp.]|nr:hypothetical protein [Phycisphaera sp.]
MAYFFQSLRTSSARARASLLALGASGALAAAVLSGCADPAVERQVKFDAQLAEVSDAYAKLLGETPDLLAGAPSEESLASLRGLIGRAKGLSGGSGAQETAARDLAASMAHTAALIGLMRANTMEADHETRRGIALSASALAAELEAIAAAAGSMDLSADRSAAQDARDAASRSARALQESVQAVEAPIGQLSTRMSESAARLNELNQETAVLVRKARESNPRTALAFVEEAAAVQESARSTRTELETDGIASSDLKLEKTLTEGKRAAEQAMQAAASRALELLSSFEADVQSQTAKTAELARELRGQAKSIMQAIADERAGTLRAVYDQLAEDLGSVGASAGSLADAVTTDEIRAAMSELAGLGAEGRMLLATAGADSAAVGEIKAKAESLLTSIREKVTAASDRLGSAEEGATPSAMSGFVNGVKSRLEGLTVDSLLTPPAVVEAPRAAQRPRAGSSGRSLAGSAGQSGVDDIDAFITRYNAVLTTDPVGAGALMMDAMDESKPGMRSMKRVSQMSAEAMRPMIDAMIERFGVESLAGLAEGMSGGMGGGMGGAMGGMAGAGAATPLTKKSDDGTRAVFASASGQETVFNKVGGKWVLDLGEAGAMSEEQLAAMEQMAPMIEMAVGPMKTAAATVAAKIRSGEIASADQVMAAFQQEIMASFGGGGRGR